jgi:hypothetical protein
MSTFACLRGSCDRRNCWWCWTIEVVTRTGIEPHRGFAGVIPNWVRAFGLPRINGMCAGRRTLMPVLLSAHAKIRSIGAGAMNRPASGSRPQHLAVGRQVDDCAVPVLYLILRFLQDLAVLAAPIGPKPLMDASSSGTNPTLSANLRSPALVSELRLASQRANSTNMRRLARRRDEICRSA